MDQIYKKRVRDTKEMVSEVDKDNPIHASKRVKKRSNLTTPRIHPPNPKMRVSKVHGLRVSKGKGLKMLLSV